MSGAAASPAAASPAAAHLFIVHSAITHLVARAALRHEGLDPEAVVFLAGRGCATDPAVRSVALPYAEPPAPEPLPRTWSPLAGRRRVRALDRFLDDASGGRPFHLYTPFTRARFIQVMKSSPRCQGFSLLEEGLASYYTAAEVEARVRTKPLRWKDRLAYAGRIGRASFYDPGHARAYCASPDAFPGFGGRVVLADVFARTLEADPGPIEAVLVFDGLSARGLLPLEAVLAAVDRVVLRAVADGLRTLHWKLHPIQVGTPEVAAVEARLAAHEGRIALARLPQDQSLEALAFARPDIRFFVNVSSTGLYAAQAGADVRSYARWVADGEPRFAATIDALPRAFHDRVRFL